MDAGALKALRSKRPRILVVRLSSLGDVILAEPLIRALRRKYPDAWIEFLTREPFAPILSHFNDIDGFTTIARVRAGGARDKLDEARWDMVVDLQNNLRSRLFLRHLEIARLARYRRPRIRRLIRIHAGKLRGLLPAAEPVLVGYLKCASHFGVEDDGGGVNLTVAESSTGFEGSANAFLVAPGARHGTKRWPADAWTGLLRQASERGYAPLAIVGGEQDAAVAREIANRCSLPVVNLAGKTTLNELVAVVAKARVLVTNDSAPMHIAAGTKTPVVAIFGPTVPEFGFAPVRCPSEVVQSQHLTCRPCHPHGTPDCPLGHHRCLRELPPLVVMEAVERLAPPNLSDPSRVKKYAAFGE